MSFARTDVHFVRILMCFVCLAAASSVRQFPIITRAASPGDTVLLPCLLPASNKDWRYHRGTRTDHSYTSNSSVIVVRDGVITSIFKDRFQLDSDGLLIRNVQATDQGTYTCFDQQRHILQTRLFVPCELMFIVMTLLYLRIFGS